MPDDRIKRPAYQWYVMDARGDEVFMLMTYEQQGIYRALLDQQWIEGSIPADLKQLATILRLTPGRFSRLWPLISTKFQKNSDGRLINARLESQRKKLDEFLEEQRKRGQIGGRRRVDNLALAQAGLGSRLKPESSSSSSTSSSSATKNKNISSATSAEPIESLTVLEFPTVGAGGPNWGLTETQVSEWQALFPSTDILAEARKALAWVRAEPGRRKTTGGMPRFLVGWLSRAVDRGASRSTTTGSAKPSRHAHWHSDGKGEIADV